MLSPKQISRTQKAMSVMTLVLLIYYVAVYRPLSRKEQVLEGPMGATWQKLSAARVGDKSGQVLNLSRISHSLEKARKAGTSLDKFSQWVMERMAVEPALQGKLSEPFKFVDFQIEQQFRIEELVRMAQQNKVLIAPRVIAGFPEFTADQAAPNLLWAQLAFLNQLLTTAVTCHVAEVRSVDLPLLSGHRLPNANEPFLYEIPIHVEILGSMENVSRFLASLSLRPEDAKALNLPPPPASRAPIFIDRVILKKRSPERPDEVFLELRACGFVYRS